MSVLSQLSQLETAGLVRVAQVTPDLEYLFSHTLFQDAAYASLLLSDQQRLHNAVGLALENLYPTEINELAATLAEHFEKAGDKQRALKYHHLAAERAAAAYANQEAESHFRSAVALSEDEALCALLLTGLGEATYCQGRFGEAEGAWREAIQLYQGLKDCDHAARLYARCARGAWFAGDTPKELNICLEGLEASANAPESEGLAYLIHEAARASYFNGKQVDASRLCHQALEMAERLGSIAVRADALTTLGILPDTSPEEALVALQKAVELAESANLLHIASRAHVNLGAAIQSYEGNHKAAKQHFVRAVELVRKRGALTEEVVPLVSAAGASLDMGEMQEAEKYLETLKSLQRSLVDPTSMQIGINALQVGLLVMQGKLDETLPLLRNNLSESQRRGDLQNLVQSANSIVEVMIELDHLQGVQDWSEGERALNELFTIADSGFGKRLYTLCLASVFKAHQKQFSQARQYYQQALQVVEGKDKNWSDIVILRAKAELAHAEGQLTEALQSYAERSGYRQTMGEFVWARTLTLWAEVLMERGEADDLEKAQGMLLDARLIFEKIGTQFYTELCNRMITATREQTFVQAKAQENVTRELKQAGVLQGSFLPQELPQVPGWRVSTALQPARSTTGDFFDFIPLPGNRLGIAIADVADKGIGAALFMASTRTLLRAFAEQNPHHPELALEEVNRRLTKDTQGGLFTTLFYGVLDPRTGGLVYCNAGHNPPFVQPVKGPRLELTGTGYPVGIFEEASWLAESIQIESGSLLVMYTDGVTEAQNQAGEFFGTLRLFQAAAPIAAGGGYSAHQAREDILKAVHEFSLGAPQADDITLVILSRDQA